ncbi:MAG: nuclear transport factor 2 family protein [Betaproteobacteria bacterium]|nr:nuclear transport factor 2 family protein [Betaproteobacteria bacterium]
MASAKELEQRIQYLEDVEAIRNLKMLYGQVCDQGYDPVKLSTMFTDDAEFNLNEKGTTQTSKGKEAITERFLLMPKRIEFAVHYFIQQTKITIEGNTATASWLMWTPQTLAGGQSVFSSGIERDVYEKVDGKWLFKKTTLDVLFRAPYGKGWGDVKLAPPPADKI